MDISSLLVITFLIKIYSRNHIFKYIKQKHGNDTQRLCRSYEKLRIRYEKCRDDLDFLLSCKKERLVHTFAKPKLSIEGNEKLRKDIAYLIIKTEITNKHKIKNQIKEELQVKNEHLRN